MTRPMGSPVRALADAGPDGPDSMGVEIAEGPDAAIATIRAIDELRPKIAPMLAAAARIVLVGTGASLAVARTAAPTWRQSALGDAEVLVRQATEVALGNLDGLVIGSIDVVLAISQSGASPETLAAARLARAAGASVLAVTAHPDSVLASVATVHVALASGSEQGAATKSGLASLAAILAIGGALGGTGEDAVVRQRFDGTTAWRDAAAAAPRLAGARHVWMLGFGAAEGLAASAALLWHEKVVRPATAASPSEFRHGLIEAVGAMDAVVLIPSVGRHAEPEAEYLDHLRAELGELRVDLVEVQASTADAALATLEQLFRLQHLARATALAGGRYREEFAILRHVVKPVSDLPG